MRTIVTLFVFLIIGFVGSRGFATRAMRRPSVSGLLVSGMEFFLLGLLLGPQALNLITDDVLHNLEPVVYLTLGWIGLLFGIELAWVQVSRVSQGVFRFLFSDALTLTLAFALPAYFVVRQAMPSLQTGQAVIGSVLLGVTISVNSPTIISLAAQRLRARGPLTNTIKIITSLNALFPLIVFGILFMLAQPRFVGLGGAGQAAPWWLLMNGMGIILGLLMVLFTLERCSDDEMRLLISGTVLLVGGVCYFLQLSALYTAMIMGFTVGNLSRMRDHVFRELHDMEKTLFVGFLVLVGAMVDVGGWEVWLLVAFTVALRLLLKLTLSGRLIAAWFPDFKALSRRGLVLSAQGGMAMAIALDLRLVAQTSLAQLLLTVVAFSVVINDLLGYGLTMHTLRGSGEAGAAGKGGMRNG